MRLLSNLLVVFGPWVLAWVIAVAIMHYHKADARREAEATDPTPEYLDLAEQINAVEGPQGVIH